jgi:hypothetical protein
MSIFESIRFEGASAALGVAGSQYDPATGKTAVGSVNVRVVVDLPPDVKPWPTNQLREAEKALVEEAMRRLETYDSLVEELEALRKRTDASAESTA